MFDPNELFYKIAEIYATHYDGVNRITICNEGGTRSSKTWDVLHFLIMYCQVNEGANNDIYVLRDSLIHCKDFTLKEFKDVMKVTGYWNSDNFKEYPKPYYNLFGNNIYFRGLDDESDMEGYPSDILFINEALETRKSKVDGLLMRCRKLVLMDWNPKYTVHWCFKLEGQPNTFFLRSTWRDNKHLQESIVNQIKGYEPTQENILKGTADEFRWKVYGLGLRASYEGLVYPEYKLTNVFPSLPVRYGLDWGFGGDPLALIQYMESGNEVYIKSLIYESGLVTNELISKLQNCNVSKQSLIVADSASPQNIAELRLRGYNIQGAPSKDVLWGINFCKGKSINILESDKRLLDEFQNYKWKEVKEGEKQQPLKGKDHLLDAFRYTCTYYALQPKQSTAKLRF